MPPTLTDQVNEIRTDLRKVRDELKSEIHDQGEELGRRIGEFREEFAGFRARVDTLIDDVPKIRNEFNDFRASIRTYLVVASWGIGILSTLTIGMIYSSISLTWNASRLHSDVVQQGKQIGDLTAAIGKLDERHSKQIGDLTAAIGKLDERHSKQIGDLTATIGKLEERQNSEFAQRSKQIGDLTAAIGKLDERHSKQIGDLTATIGKLDERQNSEFAQRSKQIGDLTAAIVKLEERQRPLEALPGLIRTLEESAKVNERMATRLDRFEEGLRPLMAKASEREWKIVVTEKERVPPIDPGRFSAFEVDLPGSTRDLPGVGTKLEPTFDGLPSELGKGIEKLEADVLNATQVRVVIHFKKLEDWEAFEKRLGAGAQIHLSLKFRPDRP